MYNPNPTWMFTPRPPYLVRRGLQQRLDQTPHVRRDLGHHGRVAARHDVLEHALERLTHERALEHRHLVEDAAQRPDVRLPVEVGVEVVGWSVRACLSSVFNFNVEIYILPRMNSAEQLVPYQPQPTFIP